MADFRDKKIDKLFRPGGAMFEAGIEDLAVAQGLIRKLRREAVARAELTAEEDDITLDPLPAKPTPQDGEAKD